MRWIIGPGTNGMNVHTVRETAKTSGYHGIRTYVFESLRTTPELSFKVSYLHAFSGIVIMACHNPTEYNELKVYGADSSQFASEGAGVIVAKVNEMEDEMTILVSDEGELKASGLSGDGADSWYEGTGPTIFLQS